MFKPEASLWLDVYDANFRGSYLTAHATISELAKTKGYIVFYSSVLAQFRYKMSSAYSIAKHGINRLAEYVDLGKLILHASLCTHRNIHVNNFHRIRR